LSTPLLPIFWPVKEDTVRKNYEHVQRSD
jgi:hypothetical protein